MPETAPRFEYRVWAPDLSSIEARIRAAAACERERSSAETYVVSAATDATNLKVRRGTLDMKVLLRAIDGLEQWTPALREPFPVTRGLLEERVFPALGVAPPDLPLEAWREEAFLADVVIPHPDLGVAKVAKTRFAFTVEGCITEVARVTIEKQAWMTAAVESVDADAVWETVRSLGLDTHPNLNYVGAVKAALGLRG